MDGRLTSLLLGGIMVAGVACGPKEEPMKVVGPPNPETQFVNEMTAKAGGDISKLTPEELKKMNQITRGNAERIIQADADRKK